MELEEWNTETKTFIQHYDSSVVEIYVLVCDINPKRLGQKN